MCSLRGTAEKAVVSNPSEVLGQRAQEDRPPDNFKPVCVGVAA